MSLPGGSGKIRFTTRTVTRKKPKGKPSGAPPSGMKTNPSGSADPKPAGAGVKEGVNPDDRKAASDIAADEAPPLAMTELPEDPYRDEAPSVSPEDVKEKEVHLFDYLQGLIGFLPDEQRNDWEASEARLKMEAIKEKLKGHGGFFDTVAHLRKEPSSPPVFPVDMPDEVKKRRKESALSSDRIGQALSFIQDLSVYHPNKEIGVALHHKIADIVHTIRKKHGSA